jgi:hypothetical protein
MPVFADPATSGKAGASRERRQPTCPHAYGFFSPPRLAIIAVEEGSVFEGRSQAWI